MKNLSYPQALEHIYKRIPKNIAKKFPEQLGLARMAYVLKLLGNPQEKYKTIHVAGTSGKGSCVCLASAILQSQGVKTGVTLSPHIIDIRERCQINGQPISRMKFAKYFSQILPTIEAVDKTPYGEVSYFETLTSLAFHSFWKEGVKAAVVETGLGGLFDATNVIKRNDKVSIISRVGLDHTAILGNSLASIAKHKTGIVQKGNRVVTIDQSRGVIKEIKSACKMRRAKLTILKQGQDFCVLGLGKNGTQFWAQLPDKTLGLTIGLIGAYQAENCMLALVASGMILGDLGKEVEETSLKQALKQASLPARFEIKEIDNKLVVFDGAHNAQKMEMFTSALKGVFKGKKLTFLLAFKHDKDIAPMLKFITPLAEKIILTSFRVEGQDFMQISSPPQDVALNLLRLSFNNFRVVPDTKQAFLQVINAENPVVTGSFYLISQIYNLGIGSKINDNPHLANMPT